MRTSTQIDDLVVAQDEESEPEPDVEEAPPPKPEAEPEAPPPSDDDPYATFDAPSDPSNEARSPRREAAREESAELRWMCRLEERINAILVDDPPRCGLPVPDRPPRKPPFPEPEPVPAVPKAARKASLAAVAPNAALGASIPKQAAVPAAPAAKCARAFQHRSAGSDGVARLDVAVEIEPHLSKVQATHRKRFWPIVGATLAAALATVIVLLVLTSSMPTRGSH